METCRTDVVLLVGMSMISRDEASRLTNKTSVIPGQHGEYVVQLDVFHQLHCLVCLTSPHRLQPAKIPRTVFAKL
jgi:hypothetical protein